MAWVRNRSTQGAFAPCFISGRIQNFLSLNTAKQQKILRLRCLNLGEALPEIKAAYALTKVPSYSLKHYSVR